MTQFSVNTKNLAKAADKLSGTQSDVSKCSSVVSKVKSNLNMDGSGVENIMRNLDVSYRNCEELRQKIKIISKALETIATKYQNTENTITGNTDEIKEALSIDQNNEEEGGIGQYLLDALEQMILGTFSDENNMAGIIGTVILGLIPYVGLACDIRDIVGDVYNLINEDATTEEWASLLVDVVALVPFADALKYSDELAVVLRNAGDGIGTIVDAARGTIRQVDEIITKVDDIADSAGRWISDRASDALTWFGNQPRYIQKAITKIPKGFKLGSDVFMEAVVENIVVDKATEIMDSIKERFESLSEESMTNAMVW